MANTKGSNKQFQFLNSVIDSALYRSALVLFVGASVIDFSTAVEAPVVNQIVTGGKWVALLFLVVRCALLVIYGEVLLREYWYEIVLTAFFTVASLISYFVSGEKGLFVAGVFLVGSYGRDYKEIIRYSLIVLVVGIIAIGALAISGVIDFNVVAGGLSDSGERIQRLSFGFNHPNALGMLIIVALLLRGILSGCRFSIPEYAAWLGIAAFLAFVVRTRTSSLVLIAGLCLIVLRRAYKTKEMASHYLGALTVVFVAIGVGIVLLYGAFPDALQGLDSILSKRLSYANILLEEYPVTLFGQKVELIGTIDAFHQGREALVLDNAYYYTLICQGAIPLVLFVLICVRAFMKDGAADSSLSVQWAICLLALVGISETLPITLLGCIPLVALLSRTDPQDDEPGVFAALKKGRVSGQEYDEDE